ncbi:MAG: hypothetical protein OEW04_00605 [Nitrospirota bacterium]|nr:hypothetical protein [Nitrospirota bacterium]
MKTWSTFLQIGFLLLSLCLITAKKAECADWVLVLEDEKGTFYIDRVTFSKNTTEVKEVRELSILKNHPEISRHTELAEYDCIAKKRRIFTLLTHFRNGTVSLKTNNSPEWETDTSQPGVEAFFRFICARQ